MRKRTHSCSPSNHVLTSKACSAEVRAPVSTFTLICSMPRSGSAAHSRQPIIFMLIAYEKHCLLLPQGKPLSLSSNVWLGLFNPRAFLPATQSCSHLDLPQKPKYCCRVSLVLAHGRCCHP